MRTPTDAEAAGFGGLWRGLRSRIFLVLPAALCGTALCADGPSATTARLGIRIAADIKLDQKLADAARKTDGNIVSENGQVRAMWVIMAQDGVDADVRDTCVTRNGRELLVLVGRRDVTDAVKVCFESRDVRNTPCVGCLLSDEGRRRLEALTAHNRGRTLVIIAGGTVRFASRIIEAWRGGIVVFPNAQGMSVREDCRHITGQSQYAAMRRAVLALYVVVALVVVLAAMLVLMPARSYHARPCPTELRVIGSLILGSVGAFLIGVHESYGAEGMIISRRIHVSIIYSLMGLIGGGVIGWLLTGFIWSAVRRGASNAKRIVYALSRMLCKRHESD